MLLVVELRRVGLLVQLRAEALGGLHQEARCGAQVGSLVVMLVKAARGAAAGGVACGAAALAPPGRAVGIGGRVRVVARWRVVAVVCGTGALRGQGGLPAQQWALLPWRLDRAGQDIKKTESEIKSLCKAVLTLSLKYTWNSAIALYDNANC